MEKGFTLMELLAVVVILALISGVGITAFSSLTKKSEEDYYSSLESNLELIASSYYADNRSKRPGINEICSKVSLNELIATNYIESAVDANGVDCDLDNSYVYIKRNSDKKYEYKTSLNCNDYNHLIVEEDYCVVELEGSSTILLSATDANGNNYIVTKSYSNTDWVKVNVTVLFDSSVAVSKYIITNTSTSDVYSCDATNNKCNYTFNKKGVYNVVSYNGSDAVGSRNFNVKIDKTSPTFTLAKTGSFNISSGTTLTYQNELNNIIDESGISKTNFIITKNGVELVNNTVSGTQIEAYNLTSGIYNIKVKAYDKVLNESETITNDFYITRSIQLIDPSNSDYNATHAVIDGTHYNYLGVNLPTLTREGYTFLGWYTTTTGDVRITSTSMVETTSVALYARWS